VNVSKAALENRAVSVHDLGIPVRADRDRFQQLFFPEGVAFDGDRFNRTAATAPFFKYLAPSESADEKMVGRLGLEPVLGLFGLPEFQEVQWGRELGAQRPGAPEHRAGVFGSRTRT
jgi:hypothetical protein